jgi:hypothetical protein
MAAAANLKMQADTASGQLADAQSKLNAAQGKIAELQKATASPTKKK